MRLIDEKGKVFGKINLIDLLVLLLLVSILPMIYFSYKHYELDPPLVIPQAEVVKQEEVKKTVFVRLVMNHIHPEMLGFINKGDEQCETSVSHIGGEKKISKKVVAKILDIHNENSEMIIDLDLKCVYKDDGTYYFYGQPVKMGLPFTFSTSLYTIRGTIVGLEENND